jgi:hypothetical protein
MVDPQDIGKSADDWFAYIGWTYYDLEVEPTIVPFESYKDSGWEVYWMPNELIVKAWDFAPKPKDPPGAKDMEVADVYALGNHYRVLVDFGYYTQVSATEGGHVDGGMLPAYNTANWFCIDDGYWPWPPWDLINVAYVSATSGYEFLGLSGTPVDLGYAYTEPIPDTEAANVWLHMFDYFWFSGVYEQCYIKSIFGFPVEVGTNVKALLSSRLEIEFEEVTSAGHVIWEEVSGPELPSGFQLVKRGGRFYDITTTAGFSGSVEIAIDYSNMEFTVPEEMLQLYHYNGAWSDCTTYIDTLNDIIYGSVDSLSIFAVIENPNPPVLIEQVITQIENLDIEQGIENNLNSKLESALKVLDDLNENNDVAAINSLEAFINAVEAQRGKKISEEDADALIEAVQQIIDMLTNG